MKNLIILTMTFLFFIGCATQQESSYHLISDGLPENLQSKQEMKPEKKIRRMDAAKSFYIFNVGVAKKSLRNDQLSDFFPNANSLSVGAMIETPIYEKLDFGFEGSLDIYDYDSHIKLSPKNLEFDINGREEDETARMYNGSYLLGYKLDPFPWDWSLALRFGINHVIPLEDKDGFITKAIVSPTFSPVWTHEFEDGNVFLLNLQYSHHNKDHWVRSGDKSGVKKMFSGSYKMKQYGLGMTVGLLMPQSPSYALSYTLSYKTDKIIEDNVPYRLNRLILSIGMAF